MNEALLKEDCCKRAYLRGAFMGGGSLSNPERGYHLEFVVRTSSLAGDLCRLLNEYDLRSKTVERNGAAVVYIKESERITDFLALIGAHGALLELETVKTNKEFKNGLNRRFIARPPTSKKQLTLRCAKKITSATSSTTTLFLHCRPSCVLPRRPASNTPKLRLPS